MSGVSVLVCDGASDYRGEYYEQNPQNHCGDDRYERSHSRLFRADRLLRPPDEVKNKSDEREEEAQYGPSERAGVSRLRVHIRLLSVLILRILRLRVLRLLILLLAVLRRLRILWGCRIGIRLSLRVLR